MEGNKIIFDNKVAHPIGVQEVRLGGDTIYKLSDQKFKTFFVLAFVSPSKISDKQQESN